jgi:hypothetical protein
MKVYAKIKLFTQKISLKGAASDKSTRMVKKNIYGKEKHINSE